MIPASDEPRLAVVVVAAGSGTRLGHETPKAFVELHGRTILEHALHGVFGATHAAQVIVVGPASRLTQTRSIADRVAGPASGHLAGVAGGAWRQGWVAAAL